jgi:hypothetical protein
MNSKLLEKFYRMFVWLTRLILPGAGFIYGYISFTEAALESGQLDNTQANEDPLMATVFGISILAAVVAISLRMILGYIVNGRMFKRYAGAFKAESSLTPHPGLALKPQSVLLSEKKDPPAVVDFAQGSYKGSRVEVSRLSIQTTARTISYTVFAFELPNKAPHIFIDGLSKHYFTPKYRSFWALRWLLQHGDKRQKLEGDFSDDFEVYAPPSQKVAVLEILTPDVMQAMQALGRGFDYEVIDNHLYIIAEPGMLKLRNSDQVVSHLQQIADEFKHQLQSPKRADHHSYLETSNSIPLISVITFGAGVYGLIFVLPWLLIFIGTMIGGLARVIVDAL